MKRSISVLFCAAVILFTLPLSAARKGENSAFYVFGDSLVDIGNDFIATQQFGFDPALPPSLSPHRTYFEGRFSNGPVEFEYLWQILEHRKPGKKKALIPYLSNPCENNDEIGSAVDFGFGGSGTGLSSLTHGVAVPGLLGQVALFACALQGQAPPDDALYAIWSASNDYFNYLSPAPLDPILTPTQVVDNIAQAIQGLYGLGARRIVVLNQPALGKVPLVLGTPASALLTALSQQHNAALGAALTQLSSTLPGLELVPVNVNVALGHVPASANATTPALDALFPPPGPGEVPMSRCLLLNAAACRNVPTFDVDLQYVFWDVQHPTTEVHRLIAEQILATFVD